jgi:hypothetical protein
MAEVAVAVAGTDADATIEETPNTNHQAPEKLQGPNTKLPRSLEATAWEAGEDP